VPITTYGTILQSRRNSPRIFSQKAVRADLYVSEDFAGELPPRAWLFSHVKTIQTETNKAQILIVP